MEEMHFYATSSNEESNSLYGEDFDGQEISMDNIRIMKDNLIRNINDLEEALHEEVSKSPEINELPERKELLEELRLALEQSKSLLTNVNDIELGYKQAMKTHKPMSEESINLAEQLGFTVPNHLKGEMNDNREEIVENNFTNGDDYKYVNFDEYEKYLADKASPNKVKEISRKEENIKNTINSSKRSFTSPGSANSSINNSLTPNINHRENERDYEDNGKEELTEEQQSLLEQQDVNQLLEHLMSINYELSQQSPIREEMKSPPNRVISHKSNDDIKPSPRFSPKQSPRDVVEEKSPICEEESNAKIIKSSPKLPAKQISPKRKEILKSDDIVILKSQLEQVTTHLQLHIEENNRLKRIIQEEKEKNLKLEYDFSNLKIKEQKTNKIASSMGEHIESLQTTIERLKKEREDKVIKQNEQIITILDTLVKRENDLLRSHVDQMKKEMKNRKVIFDEEILKLKRIIIDSLTEDLKQREFINSDIQQAEIQLMELEENFSKPYLYFPTDPEDEVDAVVAATLQSLNCPVPIEMERIAPGEYLCDKKIKIKVGPKGEALVRVGTSFIPLKEYIMKLYSPFFTSEKSIETKDIELSNNYEEEGESNDPLLQKFLFTKELVRQNSPPRRISKNESNDNTIDKTSPPKQRQSTSPKQIREQNHRSSSAPPNTRYMNILQTAEKSKKLKSLKPTPQVKKPPVNSQAYDRRNHPLPSPNYIMHNNNLLLMKHNPFPSQMNYSDHHLNSSSTASYFSNHSNLNTNTQPKKPVSRPSSTERKEPLRRTTPPKVHNTLYQNPKSLLSNIDINDPIQVEKLKRKALRMQIQQFSK
ncbi:hypothetical protein ABK040_003514 [Willaertia magna]